MSPLSRKLNCIVLLDDDVATNFIHEQLIDTLGCAEIVRTFQRGERALDFLANASCRADLMFLDLNMPGMNGWEVLDGLYLLDPSQRPSSVVILTTSLNPDHRLRAESDPRVSAYCTKPLSEEAIAQLLEHHPA